ncbi:hypothetical protein BSKO_12381 [Bryopsis sp. KO-2023]|nr:hypothetical protein BSKO_12381 [Bryopsis sp. KO-2023]
MEALSASPSDRRRGVPDSSAADTNYYPAMFDRIQKRVSEPPPLHSAKTHIGRRLKNEDRHFVKTNFIDMPLEPDSLEEIHLPHMDECFKSLEASPSRLSSGNSSRLGATWRTGGLTLDTFHLFAIFDGHGGAAASEFLQKWLEDYLLAQLNRCLETCPPPREFLRHKTVPPEILLHQAQQVLKDMDLTDISDGSDEEEKDKVEEEGPNATGGGGLRRLSSIDEQKKSVEEGVPTMSASAFGSNGSGFAPGRSDFRMSMPSDDLSVFVDAFTERSKSPARIIDPKRSVSCNDSSQTEPSGVSTFEIEHGMVTALANLDTEFGKTENASDVGSTAVVALVSHLLICISNIGDSRGVIVRGGKRIPLTRDHTPMCLDEADRVAKAGGHIVQMAYDGPRVMGILNMTRAVGDHSLRPFVIANAETVVLRRHPSDEFLLIATDGLWGEMSEEDCCNLVQRCFAHGQAKGIPRQSAVKLAANVLVKRVVEKGGADNITVIVVDLKRT